jgi:hypothetical protein
MRDGSQWREDSITEDSRIHPLIVGLIQWIKQANQVVIQSAEVLNSIVIVSERAYKDTSNHSVRKKKHLRL